VSGGSHELRATALILRTVDYGESDRIVTFFTRELGKVTAFARSARKSQKRFGGALEPFNRLAIRYRDRRGDLLSLASATIERARSGITTDLERIGRAAYVTELTGEAIREREAVPELFDLLDAGLEMLSSSDAVGGGWLAAFELKLLSLAGYRPDLAGCASCGDAAAERYRFVPDRGVIFCAGCAGGSGIAVSAGTVRALEASLDHPLPMLDRIALSPAQVEEARRLLGPFIRLQLGKELRSAKFLDEMR
jgi:DNA repair protein RecO (recombination protein O)